MPETRSAFLELEVHATVAGRLFEPAVEIAAGDFRDTQFLERGVQGTRLLNLTRLLGTKGSAGAHVRLRGRRLKWRAQMACLHLCHEKLSAADRVLVVSPHPDDAEIAAFGVYSDTSATVVTLTAGDGSYRYRSRGAFLRDVPPTTVAKIRVLDSVTIPQFSGIKPESAVNLCFPDGALAEMSAQPERDFSDAFGGKAVFASLRRLNRLPLMEYDADCSWRTLIRDLAKIIANTKPTVVVAPHPVLDPHSDHLFATVAMCEAMQSVGRTEDRVFFYCVHNRRSELWPFGPAGTGVAALPVLPEDGLCSGGFYSHVLSVERQRDKFLALEAMHDVREMEWPESAPWHAASRRLLSELRALAYGMDRIPTSYMRRAVRPDEVFFVMGFSDAAALTRRAAAESGRGDSSQMMQPAPP
jgi:LmbE family N-acetylglucosaminyl deacetylase